MTTDSLSATRLIELRIEAMARLPAPLEQILSLALHERSSARQIAQVCESTPELAARILKLANSPTMGCRQPVGHLLQAAVILGMGRIRNLALAAHLVEKLPRAGDMVDGQRFWKHAFAVAAMARVVGQGAASRYAEDMYLAGLIHDVGICILAEAVPEAYGPVLARVRKIGACLAEEEAAWLGMTHAEAGAILAGRWSVAPRVVGAVRWHHEKPGAAPEAGAPGTREVAGALIIAERVCRHHGWGLMLEEEPLPEAFDPPCGFPQPRAALLDAFGPVALASEELRKLAGLGDR